MHTTTVTLQPSMVLPPKPFVFGVARGDVSWAAAPTLCLVHVGTVSNSIASDNDTASLKWLSTIANDVSDNFIGPVAFDMSCPSRRTKRGSSKKGKDPKDYDTPLGTFTLPCPFTFARSICSALATAAGSIRNAEVHFIDVDIPAGKWKKLPAIVKRLVQPLLVKFLEDVDVVVLSVNRKDSKTIVKDAEAVDLSPLYKSNAQPTLQAAVLTAEGEHAFEALCKHGGRWWLHTNNVVRTSVHRDYGATEATTRTREYDVKEELKRGLMFFYAVG